MCDTVASELILTFSKDDVVAQELIEQIQQELIDGVDPETESLEEKLSDLELEPIDDLEFDFYRVRVPIGDEQLNIASLHFWYNHILLDYLNYGQIDSTFRPLNDPQHRFIVAPNYLLSLNANQAAQVPVQAADFEFSKYHTDSYIPMMNIVSPIDASGVKIVIIDSGVASDVPFSVSQERNFVDPNNAFDATDNNGHGTLVSLLINEVISDADIDIYKVTDTQLPNEWDVLAAVAACKDAQVINMSLAYGLGDKTCPTCGRESHSSRSAVFERMIEQLFRQPVKPILIASAGNNSAPSLAYPARFGNVVAVGSINSEGDLSHFSNYGDVDHALNYHNHRFVLPGGENGSPQTESICKSSIRFGTSFAAAYASGIVAASIANLGISNYDPGLIIDTLRQQADTSVLPNYDQQKHGHGVMKL